MKNKANLRIDNIKPLKAHLFSYRAQAWVALTPEQEALRVVVDSGPMRLAIQAPRFYGSRRVRKREELPFKHCKEITGDDAKLLTTNQRCRLRKLGVKVPKLSSSHRRKAVVKA